jgi:hypothetical protein
MRRGKQIGPGDLVARGLFRTLSSDPEGFTDHLNRGAWRPKLFKYT